ncbi:MAG: hypothetical protein ACOWYE_13175 [Desulfatiglandales bacterium]
MRKIVLVMFMVMGLSLFACSGKKAEEMFETAQFEEVQRNVVHARQLYLEILEKYPESEYANKAAERLEALKDKD